MPEKQRLVWKFKKNHCNGSKAGSKAGSANDYIHFIYVTLHHNQSFL